MTKQEHLALNKWQREILNTLKEARTCPDSAGARLLLVKTAKNLQFMGDNLEGGAIHMTSGELVSTGEYLRDMARLLVIDEPAEHLPKVIECMEALVASHDRHLAKLPDDN